MGQGHLYIAHAPPWAICPQPFLPPKASQLQHCQGLLPAILHWGPLTPLKLGTFGGDCSTLPGLAGGSSCAVLTALATLGLRGGGRSGSVAGGLLPLLLLLFTHCSTASSACRMHREDLFRQGHLYIAHVPSQLRHCQGLLCGAHLTSKSCMDIHAELCLHAHP